MTGSTKFRYDGREHAIPHRDSQKQRCYDAEDAVDWGEDKRGRLTLGECQAFADKVTRSACWRRMRERHGFANPKARKVKVEQGHHGGATAYPFWWRIRIAPGMMSHHVMLHELAHIACGPSIGHHWPFARAFADLVTRFMGPEQGKALKESFRKHKARYSIPPSPMSEERRKKLAEQGRKALGLDKEQPR